ncbi:MAG: preprotein translocase subunit YajC [Gemmataceae bacterium]|nr:preprotein translocase subunit YajC [Gemmataceae bacterium]MDW8264982.1 preprotein translocase subunit YajC [Gemmataceae bacterium]
MRWLALLAQGADAPGGPPWWAGLLPLALMALAFVLLFVLPMRKQEKQRQALIASIKKGDEVLTSGGIIGVVVSIRDNKDEMVLKVDDSSNTRIRVTRSSVVRVLRGDESDKEKSGA